MSQMMPRTHLWFHGRYESIEVRASLGSSSQRLIIARSASVVLSERLDGSDKRKYYIEWC